MSFFERSPIFLDEETVAEELRRARQAAGLKLSDIAKKLKIRQNYLEALEKGHYEALPQGVYGRNFLREYGIFLGLDYKVLLEHYESELKSRRRPEGQLFERQVVSRRHLLALPVLVRNAIIGILIVACLSYLGFLLKRIFEPPMLVIDYPPENLITADSKLIISGQSEPETDIQINGQAVLADAEGRFEREVYLQSGLNTIIIRSNKKYSRTAEVTRQVVVESNIQ